MALIILRLARSRLFRVGLVGLASAWLASCTTFEAEVPAAQKPLSKEALDLLAKKGMQAESPIYVRVFKQESELEVWKLRDDGRFHHYKTYPICNWSGDLGPKLVQGDKQAPEGFYVVSRGQMNPNSQFHLAFNVGYPNAYDRAHGRTGSALMVHGDCRSAGCYAMTNALIEEIYALARESFKGGQEQFAVHAFPFRMTDETLVRHKKDKWYPFWRTLKEGYDHFEAYRVPPTVAVCERRYVVNVRHEGTKLDPNGACPAFERPRIEQVIPQTRDVVADIRPVVVPGRKTRDPGTIASSGAPPGERFGLTTGGILSFGRAH